MIIIIFLILFIFILKAELVVSEPSDKVINKNLEFKKLAKKSVISFGDSKNVSKQKPQIKETLINVSEFNYTFEYDGKRYLGEILKALEKQTEVRVIVELKDNSGIMVRGTKAERRFLLRQRDRWFEPVIDVVLANLSEEEFVLNRKSLSGFSGKITKEGINKLSNNSIYASR